ncbi:hypothetical protein Q9Y03_004152 [Vibrio harveyi]|jgi:hypothetical protein|uniref:hypothetical protein n=1 Tax=Vibrio TaxID=662 RepID=UPI001EF21FE6|nr:hypothetical protein [Vibrio sp. MMH1-50]EKO3852961.1 hypothetical protein [Vibrio harveyi]ELE7130931.1 hypothetical protein [Vibrio harveyi]ELH4836172.1 hypothetical protein [Vibrio harveyi]MCG7517394.1 hypothetical protein [Vibrio sp. MMH1-50]HDM8126958.1 hypothetical protein [Vibrio harveyi]
MRYDTVKLGFIVAAMMNIGGVLIFSRGFNNPVISEFDPMVMSNFGLLMIVIWGLAYLGAASITSGVKWLAGAFTIEKLVYVFVWLQWIQGNSLGAVYEQDLFAGIFYSIYGLNDFVFMLFFAWVFLTKRKHSEQ